VVIPELIGGWPPVSDNAPLGDLYKASMLLLFNPWRDIKRLKGKQGSFGEAYADFEENMSDKVHVQIKNIQTFYKCKPYRPVINSPVAISPTPTNVHQLTTNVHCLPAYITNSDRLLLTPNDRWQLSVDFKHRTSTAKIMKKKLFKFEIGR
jgi:hypothetical protein